MLPPPGNFQRTDVYYHKHWRRVQYLANQFWLRWRMEYIHLLQVRNKWIRPTKNLELADTFISKLGTGRICKSLILGTGKRCGDLQEHGWTC